MLAGLGGTGGLNGILRRVRNTPERWRGFLPKLRMDKSRSARDGKRDASNYTNTCRSEAAGRDFSGGRSFATGGQDAGSFSASGGKDPASRPSACCARPGTRRHASRAQATEEIIRPPDFSFDWRRLRLSFDGRRRRGRFFLVETPPEPGAATGTDGAN